MGKESDFQRKLKEELESTFDGCIVTKLDPTFKQGIPDLLILYKDRWATLECKRNSKASCRPNQVGDKKLNRKGYVDRMNEMSFSRVVYPENKEEVINELRIHFSQS